MRDEGNMWGMKAMFYSTMKPETTELMMAETPPEYRNSIDGIKLVPLTQELIMLD